MPHNRNERAQTIQALYIFWDSDKKFLWCLYQFNYKNHGDAICFNASSVRMNQRTDTFSDQNTKELFQRDFNYTHTMLA